MSTSYPQARELRKARFSSVDRYYFLTTNVAGRRPLFTQADFAGVVLDAIRWLDQNDRFDVDAAVVMPDHLHLVGQLRHAGLASVLQSLKGFTGGQLMRRGVAAPVWQAGYHDHCLRDREDYGVKVMYVLNNPVRAGLVRHFLDYPYLIVPSWCRGLVG